jgi:hypothetical protein
MDSGFLHSRLEHLGAIVLQGATGGLRVLDKAALVACDISPSAADEERVTGELESLLTRAAESASQPAVRISIDVVRDALELEDVAPALIELSEFLAPIRFAQISIHFDALPDGWSSTLSRLKQVRESLRTPREVEIQLIGPFSVASQREMELMFEIGARVRFAAGWTHGDDHHGSLDVHSQALRAYSEFGFRAPVVWYVHADNLSACEESLSPLLIANYCSGFSLPLVSVNPFYRFEPGFPRLPAAADYCQLLIRCYGKYPYYDDVLSPLTELALLVREGGWQSEWNVSTALRFSIDAQGVIGMYRQAPSLAQPWTTISEIANLSREALRQKLFAALAQAWTWERNDFCRRCRWRHVCGGLDGFSQRELAESELDTMCGYRKLFLEHFASIRTADCIVDGS